MYFGFRSACKDFELIQKASLHLGKYSKLKLTVTHIVLYPYGPSMAKYWQHYFLAIPGRNTSAI